MMDGQALLDKLGQASSGTRMQSATTKSRLGLTGGCEMEACNIIGSTFDRRIEGHCRQACRHVREGSAIASVRPRPIP